MLKLIGQQLLVKAAKSASQTKNPYKRKKKVTLIFGHSVGLGPAEHFFKPIHISLKTTTK